MTAAGAKSPSGKRVRKPSPIAVMRREEIIRLALAMVPIGTIAKRVSLSRDRVRDILDEPENAARMKSANDTAFKDAQAVLRRSTRRAAGVLEEELESTHGHVRLRAAIEILSKSGADAPKRFDVGVLAGMTDEELWHALEELRRGKASEPSGGDAT